MSAATIFGCKGLKVSRKAVVKFSTSTGTALLGVVVAAALKGEPLNGLTRLSKLNQFLHTSVPLWALSIPTFLAAFALTGWLLRLEHKAPVPGMIAYKERFQGHDYEVTMDSDDLLLVFNDGKSWIPGNKEALERRVLQRHQK